jgi:hypothetical protein
VETFTCPNCSKQLPVNKAVRIPVVASIGVFIITLGGVAFGKLCPNCESEIVGLGAIGALFGVVLLIVFGAKWLWG